MGKLEHEVKMKLPGNPRWWTLTTPKGTLEVVRVVFDRKTYFPTAPTDDPRIPSEMVIFALLQPGQFAFPALVSSILRTGTPGMASIRAGGGKIALYEEPLGKKLELMLVGFGG